MSAPVGLPQFSHIDTERFKTHLEGMLKNHLEQVDLLIKNNHYYTWDNLMYPLEDLDDELERFWSPFSHLHSVMDSPVLRDCYDECLPLLSAYEAAMGQNHDLYMAIKSIDTHALNAAQKKLIADSLLGFELSGVALEPQHKKRFEEIQTRLDELSNQFEHNILDASQAFTIHITDPQRVAGIPEHALNTARELAEEKGLDGYIFTLEAPSYQAVITHAEDRALREEIYQAYVTRASDQGPNAGKFDNTANMNEILALRHEQAKLLGFHNYAELSLATKMADSTTQVMDFMNDLVKRAHHQAEGELAALKDFAASKWSFEPLQPWDISYLSEKEGRIYLPYLKKSYALISPA